MLKVIQKKIQDVLPDANITINSDDNIHFNAVIISDSFFNATPMQRQRMVYSAINEDIKNGTIHAISLKTFTQAEWSAKCIN